MSLRHRVEMPREGEEARMHIFTKVAEDQLALFGFAERDEKRLFERLIAVSMTVLTTTGGRHAPSGRSSAEDGGKPAILAWARKPERSEAGKIVERRRCVDTIGALARTFRRYRPSSENAKLRGLGQQAEYMARGVT